MRLFNVSAQETSEKNTGHLARQFLWTITHSCPRFLDLRNGLNRKCDNSRPIPVPGLDNELPILRHIWIRPWDRISTGHHVDWRRSSGRTTSGNGKTVTRRIAREFGWKEINEEIGDGRNIWSRFNGCLRIRSTIYRLSDLRQLPSIDRRTYTQSSRLTDAYVQTNIQADRLIDGQRNRQTCADTHAHAHTRGDRLTQTCRPLGW